MSEYIVELPMSGAADEFIAKHGVDDCRLYGYKLTGEIVRCRDCKFRCLNECTRIDEGFKDYWFAIEPNGYCAWGERMEWSE